MRKKCENCGHPPGKHLNLRSVTSSSTRSLSTAKSEVVSFLVGPKCAFSGCTEEAHFDLNTSTQGIYCQEHVKVMEIASLDAGSVLSDSDDDSGTLGASSSLQTVRSFITRLLPSFGQSQPCTSQLPDVLSSQSEVKHPGPPTAPSLLSEATDSVASLTVEHTDQGSKLSKLH